MAGDSTDSDPNMQRVDLDATGEFFSVGSTLHAVRAGYIQRRADQLLYEALTSGRFAHVLAPARSGKSSLIAATSARLESNGYKVAILDLAQLGDSGTESGRWYYSVAYRLLRQLRIRYDLQTWWQDKSILSNRQRLVEFYSEVILQHVPDQIVVFVDEIQCIEDLGYADQLLSSIRAAHNARTTDPDFTRLSFVLLGECDPVSLIQEAELSPFNVTQQISLDDFSREEIRLFATELNRERADAELALDRIYYWTNGQPYLTQKLARAVAREGNVEAIEEMVDRLVYHQLAGRAALHSEPHMSHIHRSLVTDDKRTEPLLNLYGKIRKGIKVPADLGSALQRRLMAVGLLTIDEESNVRVRNRIYEAVFTARWANENLPTRLKVPAIVAGVFLIMTLIPFWYTQWLPLPYARTMASESVDITVATEAFENLRSFPGHDDAAENLYRGFLQQRARAATSEAEILEISELASRLNDPGRLAEGFVAGFWDRQARDAIQSEDRDTALLARIKAFALPTPVRRQRAAALIGDDYPFLLRTLPSLPEGNAVFDAVGMILTTAVGAKISQHSYTPQGLQQREPWSVTALEVSPLVRRVIVDREGVVSRIGLTLNISHTRLSDLRIKIIAPSGRTVEIETGLEHASSNHDIQIPATQLRELISENLNGTWSISVRDESLGVAGQLVGWNLKLNSQGAVEYFQRGLNIPDPVERETDNIWFDRTGRYAIARAMQSDSARIWDLAFAEPVRAIALPESELLIGLDASARRLVSATQGTVNLWDAATGDKIESLAIGAASNRAVLTPDGTRLFVERRSDFETRLEIWSLDDGILLSEVVVAGVPALLAIDAAGRRVAVADFDRAIRVWEFQTGELLGQFDMASQPGEIYLSADGETLGAVYPDVGVSLWDIDKPQRPMLEDLGRGNWQMAFSPSGNLVAAGRPQTGFQIFSSDDGRLTGPPLGVRKNVQGRDFLAFSQDEQLLLTGSKNDSLRFWRVPGPSVVENRVRQSDGHAIWSPAADRSLVASPDGRFVVIGDPSGHIHVLAADGTLEELAAISDDVSFVGHRAEVRRLSVDPSGQFIASVAADNTLRVWRAEGGEPLPYVVEIDGPPVSQIAMSPTGKFVGMLNGSRVSVVDVTNGTIATEFDSGVLYTGLTFASDEGLYIGDQNGNLQLLSRSVDGNWNTQQLFHSPAGIRLLKASPQGDYLILVDQANVASQFVLAEGRIADATLQIASDVREVAFDANGTRIYFATARWVHRANPSPGGLVWMDALFAPRPLKGAGIVHGDGESPATARHKMFMPVARNAYFELVELDFGAASAAGLFGSREELLREWQNRISAVRPEEF